MSSPSVVRDIAARRRSDMAAELAGLTRADLERGLHAAPPPRDVAGRLAEPGLAVIAEVKRSSPPAGRLR